MSPTDELTETPLIDTTERLRKRLRNAGFTVAVYGLGKMGLPLAAVFADVTGSVIGVDVDQSVVESVSNGDCHVEGEPGLATLVYEQVERDRLTATTDGSDAAATASIHVLIVPTLLDDDDRPDLSALTSSTTDVASGLDPGDLVVVESTVPPGTCRDVIAPLLANESGLDPDAFALAHCPERTSSGSALRDIRGRYPKVIGGVDAESARYAATMYAEVTDAEIHVVSDATTAEAVKVFEGVYRDVNIALANDLVTTAADLDISVREAIAAANELPMCHIHDPGPGVGGHCIPNYPHFLLERTGASLRVVRAARSVNENMPKVTVDVLRRALFESEVELDHASVALLGVTYRAGVAETRSSPAIAIIDTLEELGATVYAVDPLVEVADLGAKAASIEEFPNLDLDAVVLVTDHDCFDRIDWSTLDPLVVLDGRDALERSDSRHRWVTLGGPERAPLRWPREDSVENRVGNDPSSERESRRSEMESVSGGLDDV